MNETEKGVAALKDEIRAEIRGIYKLNMTFEGWSVPEMDAAKAKERILAVMQEALDELKEENQ
ncbi:hypothetical protein [Sulfurospirillum sp. 1612]|uniref:hypothetical protein n=1 Tax=Sulfurospirillum sp. 1612 TaxID=3094835 RepID=UPI002F9429BD